MQARAKGLYPMGLFRSAPNFRSASHSPTDARACRIIFVCGSLAAGHTGRIKGARHGHQPVNQRKKKRDFPRRICSGRQIRARQNARSFAEYIGALPTPPAAPRVAPQEVGNRAQSLRPLLLLCGGVCPGYDRVPPFAINQKATIVRLAELLLPRTHRSNDIRFL